MRGSAPLFVVVALIMAACGSGTGDGAGSLTTSVPTTTTTMPATTTTALPPTTTTTPTATTTTMPVPGWTRVPAEAIGNGYVKDVADLNGTLVAVGMGSSPCSASRTSSSCWAGAWVSKDEGRSWTAIDLGPVEANAIAVTETHFIVVGSDYLEINRGSEGGWDGVVWTSPDGENWTKTQDPVFTDAHCLTGIAVGPDGLVAAGRSWIDDTYAYRPSIWTSSDGVTWTKRPHDQSVFGGLMCGMDITSYEGGYVATSTMNDSGRVVVWTSPDGDTWQRNAIGSNVEYYSDSVVAANRQGIIVGAENQLWFSPDRSDWNPIASVNIDGDRTCTVSEVVDVQASDAGFIAAGSVTCSAQANQYAAVWASPDGMNWRVVSTEAEMFKGSITVIHPFRSEVLVFGRDQHVNPVLWIWDGY